MDCPFPNARASVLVGFLHREKIDDGDVERVGDFLEIRELQVRHAAFDLVDGGAGDAGNAGERRDVHSRFEAKPLDGCAENHRFFERKGGMLGIDELRFMLACVRHGKKRKPLLTLCCKRSFTNYGR